MEGGASVYLMKSRKAQLHPDLYSANLGMFQSPSMRSNERNMNTTTFEDEFRSTEFQFKREELK